MPAQAASVVRIFEDYAAGISPGSIVRRLNEEGVPPPRSGRRDRATSGSAPAWTPNTLTGNAERGTGILNNQLYVGRRAHARQTYRKSPDTGRRHAFLNAEEQQATTVAAQDLRIVSDALWQSVKHRQQSLRRGPTKARNAVPALPFFARQRPKYLTTATMTRGEYGSSYAKSGRARFCCSMFIGEMRAWAERPGMLLAEAERAFKVMTPTNLLHADLGNTYRQKAEQLTAAFEDDALKARASERLRALIETVVLTTEDGDLAIDLRGELASMLSLCAGAETQKASAAVTEEVFESKVGCGDRI